MRIKTTLRSNFVAGLVLVTPLLVTLVVLKFALGWVGGTLAPVIEGTRLATFTANNLLLAQVLAVLIFVVLVTLLGFIAQWSAGQRLLGRTGRVVDFIPVFRTVYGSVRQMASSVVNRSSDYESVVYVEYRPDIYHLGLKTGDGPSDLEEQVGEPVHNVFMPGSPNPTQGSLTLVPDSRVKRSDLSVRGAVRLLMTTGSGHDDDVIELSEDELLLAPEEREE